MSEDATDQLVAAEIFREVIAVVHAADLDYAVGGGIATEHWTGGANEIRDIDLLLSEEHATKLLTQLEDKGYERTEMEHSWLHKASKNNVTIDLMFELKNDVRFDQGLKDHRRQGEMFGTRAFVISPEDQVAALAGTVDRSTIGQHWYNMIDIMANNDLDWAYLLERAATVPFQMLSVVYFALSRNVPVQKGVIDQLMKLAA